MLPSLRSISAVALVAATSSSALLSIPSGSTGGSTGGITSGLSIGCQAALSGLISSSSAACLSLNVFLSNVGGLPSNASAVNGLNAWLVNGVCNRAQCSSSDITATKATVNSGCSSDLGSSTFNGAQLVSQLLDNYTAVRQGGCLQDTTNSSSLCLTESMYIVEQKGSTTLTLDKLTNLISDASAGSAIVNSLSPKNSICTDCTHALKTVLVPSGSSSFGKTIISTCGSTFNDGQIPSSVKQDSLDGTGTSSSASSSPSKTSGSGAASGSSTSKPDGAVALRSTSGAIAGLSAAAVVAAVVALL